MTEQDLIERRRGYRKKYHSKPSTKKKHYARGKVAQAIKMGRLKPAEFCEKCGAKPAEAHHENYSKPLKLKWFCRKCHMALHHKTHCLRGHPLTPDNVYTRPNGNTHCRRCVLDKMQAERDAVKAERRRLRSPLSAAYLDLSKKIAPNFKDPC